MGYYRGRNLLPGRLGQHIRRNLLQARLGSCKGRSRIGLGRSLLQVRRGDHLWLGLWLIQGWHCARG